MKQVSEHGEDRGRASLGLRQRAAVTATLMSGNRTDKGFNDSCTTMSTVTSETFCIFRNNKMRHERGSARLTSLSMNCLSEAISAKEHRCPILVLRRGEG